MQNNQNLVHRNINDLTVLTYQRTLYIADKLKAIKQLTSSEHLWHASSIQQQQKMALKMKTLPKNYYENVYLYLNEPEIYKARLITFLKAEKEGNLAPWPKEWSHDFQLGSEDLYKTEDLLQITLLKKFKKPQKTVNWLKPRDWALLTPLQKRNFRVLKKQPTNLIYKLFLHKRRQKKLYRRIDKFIKINYANLKNCPYFKKYSIKYTKKKVTPKVIGAIFYKLSQTIRTLIPFAFYARIKSKRTVTQLPTISTLKKMPFYKKPKKVNNTIFLLLRANFISEIYVKPFINVKQYDSNKIILYQTKLLTIKTLIFLNSQLVVCKIKNHTNNVNKMTLHFKFKKRRRKVVRRFFFRRVITCGIEVLKQRFRGGVNKHNYRLKVFRNFFRRQFSRFRHIGKNRLFIDLFRAHFKATTGYDEKKLMYLWFKYRRKSTKYWGMINLVTRFSQSLLLTPTHLILFFGLAPTLAIARAIANVGAITLNGLTVISIKACSFAKPGDTIQLTPSLWAYIKKLYFYQQWSYIKLKLSQVSFFQVDWPMLIFTLVTWPKAYELVPPSYLSERWIRYYIRHFPVRQRKYQKVKMVWKSYPRIKSKYRKSH